MLLLPSGQRICNYDRAGEQQEPGGWPGACLQVSGPLLFRDQLVLSALASVKQLFGASQQHPTKLLSACKHAQAAHGFGRILTHSLQHLFPVPVALPVQEWSPAVKAPLKEKGSASNAQRSVFEVAWDCNMDLTGRGVRGELALDVAVADFGCVTVPIMAKVYRGSDSSAVHGEEPGAWESGVGAGDAGAVVAG